MRKLHENAMGPPRIWSCCANLKRIKKLSGSGNKEKCPGRIIVKLWEVRDKVREATAQLGPSLARDVKENRKGF